MISKAIVLSCLVAVVLSASVSDQWETRVIEAADLPSEVQDYLDQQLVNLPEDENEVELMEPPLALEEAALARMNLGENRVKRRTVVCRYVVGRVRKTGRKIVIVRCR